jgi:Glycosyl transferases group 1
MLDLGRQTPAMAGSARQLKTALRQFLGRQRNKIVYRVGNPLRFIVELLLSGLVQVTALSTLPRSGHLRVALVSDHLEYTSEEQFNGFWMYRSLLRKKLGLISIRLCLNDALQAPAGFLSLFNVIILKLSYRTERSRALGIVEAMRNMNKTARIIYFDGDDDLCIQWPEILSIVDLYVKKHIFSDKKDYLRRFVGKSNLHDYVHHKYGHHFSAKDFGDDKVILWSGPVPETKLEKITLGYNLALDQKIVKLFSTGDRYLKYSNRTNDILFRGTIPPHDIWLSHLRKSFEPILDKLGSDFHVIVSDKRLSEDLYYKEMANSKICFSPFGYGEICWRDFEAIICRCLLLKPDVSHLSTCPQIFIPYVTYVPIKWDFSDLEEKCRYYASNDSERSQITKAAFDVLRTFYAELGGARAIASILGRRADFGL